MLYGNQAGSETDVLWPTFYGELNPFENFDNMKAST